MHQHFAIKQRHNKTKQNRFVLAINFGRQTATQHLEATSGALRAARGTAEKLAAHSAGEERCGTKRHRNRGRSGIHIVYDNGGHSAQDVVRGSTRATWTARETLRRHEANNLPTYNTLEAAACMANYVTKMPWRAPREHRIP
jgi:hypothetical protein